MGKLNFRGYLISRFYPTREICENQMYPKNMCFTVTVLILVVYLRHKYLKTRAVEQLIFLISLIMRLIILLAR